MKNNKNTEKIPSTIPPIQYKEFEPLTNIARLYGFVRVPPINITTEDELNSKNNKKGLFVPEIFSSQSTAELVALLNAYTRKELAGVTHPPLLFHEGTFPHSSKKTIPSPTLTLDVIQSANPLVDVALIHIGLSMLSELSSEKFVVAINSVGDKESANKFNKELTQYYKKNASMLSGQLKQLIKKDIISARIAPSTTSDPIQEQAPQSIHCLSETSAHHCKEFLTYIDKIKLDYTIDPRLIPDRSLYEETIFTITSNNPKKDSPYVIGMRYSSLSKKLGNKKDIPGMRMILVAPKVKHIIKNPPVYKEKKYPFHFVQIGIDAKLKSLNVLEMLRKAKISVHYTLIKDKLVGQLSLAEQAHADYVLLMGQKECLEDSVLVRNMINSAQETVSISELVGYLKKLKVSALAKK